MSSKSARKKSNIQNVRVYFITNQPDADIMALKSVFENKRVEFIDKYYKSKITNKPNEETKYFINIRLNIQLTEDTFIKFSKKINNILNSKNKIFYVDENNKYIYYDCETTANIKSSLCAFIDDD
jgi:hypothetical protein